MEIPQRAAQGRLFASLAAAAVVVAAALVALAPAQTPHASAEAFEPVSHEGTISESEDVDWFVLFALTGESYALSLERNTLLAGQVSIWQPAGDNSTARLVARSSGLDTPLIWTATASGAWRVQVAGLRDATGSYRLRIRSHADAVGTDLSTAKLSQFDDQGVMVERSSIDAAGDADWFAFPVAAGNRYAIWSIAGSVPGLSASFRGPGSESFRPLSSKGNVFSDSVTPSSDGVAVIEVRASTEWFSGSYAFGVTRRGQATEPEISLPPPPMPVLQVEAIEGSASLGEAEFWFRGTWGPIPENSGLRVWIDVDAGTEDEGEWDYLLRSNDGRRARLWSFQQDRWVDSSRVGARGFDTLVLLWSGRTANEQIRWQASVKNSDGSWTLSRPSVLDVPDPPPQIPPLWPSRLRTGREDPRWNQELAAAGVVADQDDDQFVVVLDPGHGVDTGAWSHAVLEATSNLSFALRIEELLADAGVHVVLTRRAAGRPFLNLDEALWRADYQVRAELAHIAKADLFISIHSNANYLFPSNGLEAWYFPRWNGDGLNLELSEMLLSHVQRALGEYGYPTGTLTYDASCWELVNGVCDPIYVLAPFLLLDADAARRWGWDLADLGLSGDPWDPAINDWLWRHDVTRGEPPIDLIDPTTQSGPGRIVRGNLMPTTLLELLYVTYEDDARILRDPQAREVIAQAIADGILEFLDLS